MAGLSVNATVLRQHGTEIYQFPMNSTTLSKLAYVTPLSRDNPQEVQRILNKKRAKTIGEYIKQPGSYLPNAIIVSLTSNVKIRDTGDQNVKIVEFPAEEGKYAYVLDGQHRIAGFRYSDGTAMDLPVVAFHDADETTRAKIFADINSTQVRVTDVQILDIYYRIRALPQDESRVVDVVVKLSEEAKSPLKGRVKRYDEDKATWIKSVQLKKFLTSHLVSGGVLSSKSVPEQSKIIKSYFEGIAKVWPEAYGEPKRYSLFAPLGIEVMLAVFPEAKHRVDLNAQRQYTPEHFQDQLEVLRDAELDLSEAGLGTISVTWAKGTMAWASNQAGRELLKRKFKDILISADED